MLFLLNDVVLNLDANTTPPPLAAAKVAALQFDEVTRLGSELFAEDPILQRTNLDRAKRLAMLIMAKSPQINAALFVSPSHHCAPDQVTSRYAEVSFDVMGGMWSRQQRGELRPIDADSQVWRRLAA